MLNYSITTVLYKFSYSDVEKMTMNSSRIVTFQFLRALTSIASYQLNSFYRQCEYFPNWLQIFFNLISDQCRKGLNRLDCLSVHIYNISLLHFIGKSVIIVQSSSMIKAASA